MPQMPATHSPALRWITTETAWVVADGVGAFRAIAGTTEIAS